MIPGRWEQKQQKNKPLFKIFKLIAYAKNR